MPGGSRRKVLGNLKKTQTKHTYTPPKKPHPTHHKTPHLESKVIRSLVRILIY